MDNDDNYNKLTPDDLPIVICGITGRPTAKKDAVFQNGMWIRKGFEDKKRRQIVPKGDD
jgi:hypothetical protein